MFKYIILDPETQRCIGCHWLHEFADTEERDAMLDYLKHEHTTDYIIEQKEKDLIQ